MSEVGTGKAPGQNSVTSSCIAVRKTPGLEEMESPSAKLHSG